MQVRSLTPRCRLEFPILTRGLLPYFPVLDLFWVILVFPNPMRLCFLSACFTPPSCGGEKRGKRPKEAKSLRSVVLRILKNAQSRKCTVERSAKTERESV